MIIQWFPGHMVKARRLITENLKLVDAVCEVTDARIPLSSRNPDLDELTGGKPRLIVLNRTDQADPEQSRRWADNFRQAGAAVIETDCKSGKGVNLLRPAIHSLLKEKTASNAAKGQSGKQLRIMIAGIPNVGKSSLINRAAGRKAAQTSDRPGVTRGKQWIKLGSGIEMLDTPGVLWPKFEDQTVAENLAFTGAIRDEVIDAETLGARLMLRLAVYYPGSITGRYKLSEDEVDKAGKAVLPDGTDEAGFNLLTAAARKRGFLASGALPDTERMASILLDEFRGGKLGRITLERIDIRE